MRTCVLMYYTNGRSSRFAVLRGPMIGDAFDAARADVVHIHETTEPPTTELYRWLADRHATPDAPPVYWQELERPLLRVK